jgi:hypothetical protein
MTEIEQLKKLRKFILTKYTIAHLSTKSSIIQLDLEDIDFVLGKAIEKELIEIKRSAIRANNELISFC